MLKQSSLWERVEADKRLGPIVPRLVRKVRGIINRVPRIHASRFSIFTVIAGRHQRSPRDYKDGFLVSVVVPSDFRPGSKFADSLCYSSLRR